MIVSVSSSRIINSFIAKNVCPLISRCCTSSATLNISTDLIVERSSPHIVEIILNRNSGKNSFSRKFLGDLKCAIRSLSDDRSIRCLILRSSVPQVFCAGADLKERSTMPVEQVADFVDSLRTTFRSLELLPFPTIAAIEGAALGGGLELAMACDLRVAGANAILGLPETSLAIIPGAGGTQRLPRIVGVAKAKEMIFLSKRINSIEAKAIGLVTEAVDAGSAAETAMKLAINIASKGPIAQRVAKRALMEGASLSIQEALAVEKSCYSEVIGTADRIEGLRAFVEKRPAAFTGI